MPFLPDTLVSLFLVPPLAFVITRIARLAVYDGVLRNERAAYRNLSPLVEKID
jgi:hypothetical protein